MKASTTPATSSRTSLRRSPSINCSLRIGPPISPYHSSLAEIRRSLNARNSEPFELDLLRFPAVIGEQTSKNHAKFRCMDEDHKRVIRINAGILVVRHSCAAVPPPGRTRSEQGRPLTLRKEMVDQLALINRILPGYPGPEQAGELLDERGLAMSRLFRISENMLTGIWGNWCL